jgi:hypothetical protein
MPKAKNKSPWDGFYASDAEDELTAQEEKPPLVLEKTDKDRVKKAKEYMQKYGKRISEE